MPPPRAAAVSAATLGRENAQLVVVAKPQDALHAEGGIFEALDEPAVAAIILQMAAFKVDGKMLVGVMAPVDIEGSVASACRGVDWNQPDVAESGQDESVGVGLQTGRGTGIEHIISSLSIPSPAADSLSAISIRARISSMV